MHPQGSVPLSPEAGQTPGTSQNSGTRYLAIVGLSLCIWANVWDLLNLFQNIVNFLDQLTEIYVVLASLVCISLEGVDQLCGGCARSSIIQHFPFLNTISGRGVAYFVLGSLTASGGSLMPILGLLQLCSGCFLMCVGVMQMATACCGRDPDKHHTGKASAAVENAPEGTLVYSKVPLRWLALIGLAVCVWVNAWYVKKDWSDSSVSLLHFLSSDITHPFALLIHIYLVIAGVGCFALECVNLMFCGQGRKCIISLFPFLNRSGGRGVTYFAMGSLTAAEGYGGLDLRHAFDWEHHLLGLVQLIGGLFLMVLGFVMGLLAHAAVDTPAAGTGPGQAAE